MSMQIGGLNSYIDPSVTSSVTGKGLSGKLDNMDSAASAEELKRSAASLNLILWNRYTKKCSKRLAARKERTRRYPLL